MNIKLYIPFLIASVFLVSCDGNDSGEDIFIGTPIAQRPVVTNPITSADISDLNTLYIGLTTEQAISVAAKQEHIFRIVSIDGTGLPVTADFRNGRINASIENNRVVSIGVEIINL